MSPAFFSKLCTAIFVALTLLATSAQAEIPTGTPLRIGILPTLSARLLLKSYQPLRVYLEKELQRPVEMVTASSFKAFHEATLAGDYDLVVTAAHLGRLAETQRQFIPLVTYKAPNRAVLIQAKDRPLASVKALRGQTLAIPDRHALIVSQTLHWLSGQGLNAGVDFSLVETPSHNSAAHSVQSHESVMAIVSPAGWKQIPPSIKDFVQIFAMLDEIPGLMWLASPKLADERLRLRSLLLGFTAASPDGAAFYDATGYKGMRALTAEDMKALEPFARDIASVFKTSQ